MALVWTLTSPKGGAGKTTLALCIAGELANRGVKVTIIDTDPNRWIEIWKGENPNPDNIKVFLDSNADGKTLLENIEKAKSHSDIVIVDTEGTNNIRANLALKYTDLALVPIMSAISDMKAGLISVRFVKDVSKATGRDIPYLIVRTNVSAAIYDKDARDVDKALKQLGEPVAQTRLISRSAFKRVQAYGGSIYTLTNKQAPGLPKARKNTEALLNDILKFYSDNMESQ